MQAVAGSEETPGNLLISSKVGANIGVVAGFVGGPVGTGIMLGLLGPYGVSKLAQSVVRRNGGSLLASTENGRL